MDYPDLSVTVVGPEAYANAAGSVICWRGVNYVQQEDPVEGKGDEISSAREEGVIEGQRHGWTLGYREGYSSGYRDGVSSERNTGVIHNDRCGCLDKDSGLPPRYTERHTDPHVVLPSAV